MDSNSNQNTTLFTNVVNNTQNMGTYDEHNNTILLHGHHDHDHRQIPMGVHVNVNVNVNYPHHMQPSSSSNNFLSEVLGIHLEEEEEGEEDLELGAMKEMMYKMAAMQPVDIDPASVRKPKRRNVRISEDPQSVAARHRRERISEKIRILQRLVPGGTKMDTASMLDEAIRYVKFLKRQIRLLQSPPPPHSQLLPSINNTTHCPFAPILFNDSSTTGLANHAHSSNHEVDDY